MKTSSSDLFLLIKSMTKSEKGHFKKQSNYIKGDKIYLRLFDAIDCQQEYDENKIKEKFKHESFIQQLSVAKINLYSNILKSLSQSSISNNTRFELRAGVNNAEILFNKGLTSQALKMIKKLKSDALEIEDFDILLLLLNLQKTIILKTFSEIDPELDAIYREEISIIDKRRNFVSYQRLYNKAFYLLTRYGHIRNKKEEAKYEEILKSEYMKNEGLADSISSKIHYNEALLYYNISKMDFNEALKCTTKCIELISKNERYLKAHIDKYFSIYQNHILQYYYLENYSSVESAYRKLLTLLNNRKLNISERLKAYSTGKILCIRFVSFIRSANFDAAAEAQKEIKQLINNYSHLLDNSIKIILFNMSSYYNFIEENYTEALKWINMMLNDKEMKYFIEMFCNAKWFELLIHYELKNYNYIDNILNTNERYIDKKQKLYGIEKLMIKFLRDALRSDDITDQELFHKLLSDIRKIANKQTESDYGIDYFNIAEWVNSKLKNKPLKKILKENRIASETP